MANKRTIVEINGRKYDAATGKIVTETPTATPVIDGFQAPIQAQAKPTQPQTAARTVNSAHAMHQKPQKTKKLHPAALKNPSPPKKVMAQSSQLRRSVDSVAVQPKRLGQHEARAQRAEQHAKSEHVRKFQFDEVEDVQTAPEPVAEPEPAPQPPVVQPMSRPQVPRPAPKQEVSEEPAEEKQPGALSRLRSRRPRLVPAAITTAVLLVVGGFVAYQNIPNMALRVAAQRAGFNASLPGYSPSGFGFAGPVSYSEGIVELEYRSHSDERAYKLIQRESSWDSKSLLDNFVATTSDDYLTFQERGLTVYIYDTSNATWVDGGIWYTVEGNSLLTSEQLLKIAASL